VKIKMDRTPIFPGYVIWSFTLRKDRFRAYVRTTLFYESKRSKVSEYWKGCIMGNFVIYILYVKWLVRLSKGR